ncbi:MAG: sialate O-acetylesterase, partial [Gracilibacteraceae bacterium]|nr:sialate O-acetylesterase [Gracilibacteraceae bacterium]
MKPKTSWLSFMIPFILLLICSLCFVSQAYAEDNNGSLILNGDFEAFIPFENLPGTLDGGNNTFTIVTIPENVYEGNAALRIQQNTLNAFAGFPLVLEPGCTYVYEYWIKVLHDSAGNPVTNINATTNFVFHDPDAFLGQNHFPGNASHPLSTGGDWTHVTGSWTPPLSFDPAATPEETWFSIYMDHFEGRSMVYVIDNVSLVKQGENLNLIPNNDFELMNPAGNVSGNNINGGNNTFSIDTTNAYGSGKTALTIRQDTINAFAGFPFAIEPGCTYAFEYQIKVISDSAGNPVSNINATTNFVFYEPGAHDSQNHFSGSVPLSTGEDWKLVSGSWTASSNMNPGATPEEAWFTIYMDHFQGRSMIYVIDNVKLIKKTHTVTYNYGANGGAEPGTGNATAQKTFNNGALVEMPATADKDNNWQFVGWNRDRNAREGEDPFQVAQNVELFAIYKKEFTVTLIDYTSSTPTTPPREVTETIYGGTTATVTIPTPNSYNPYTGWTPRGWCYAGSMAPNAEVAVEPGELIIDKDETLYALYQLVYTVHYDTQGDPIIPDDTTTRYANSYDISNTVRDDIILPTNVVKDGSTLDRWRSTFSGYTFLPGAPFPPSAVYTTLEALWIETPAPVQSFDLPESNLISDNMLIQRDKPIHLWGTSTAAESLTITASIRNGQEILSTGTTTVAPGAAFSLTLPPLAAGGPYTLEIRDNKGYAQTISNVLIGELWHFSGQSNMVSTVGSTGPVFQPEIVPATDIDAIRYFSVGSGGTDEWKIATPADVPSFSAVAYTALAKMKDGLDNVPVGGICTAQGSQKIGVFQGVSARYPDGGDLFNERIEPLTNLSIRGHMWYQGESDSWGNVNYVVNFETMINSWREAWNDAQQPFIFVQLPQSPANASPGMRNFTEFRKWQVDVWDRLAGNNVGMIVSIDTNTNSTETGPDPLHSRNKKPIGERLGLYALGSVYDKEVPYLSPMYESVSVDGNQITVVFKHVYDGLQTSDGLAPKNFQVMDSNGVYYAADSVVISGTDKLLISSSSVANPVRVAYFEEKRLVDLYMPYVGLPVNLTNSAGLPASPFVVDCFTSLYDEVDWRYKDPSGNLGGNLAHWSSINGGYQANPVLTTGTDAAKCMIASKIFTQAELPVGSIVVVDGYYWYRPEGWGWSGEPAPGRPLIVDSEVVVIDEDWWHGYEKRAFNIGGGGYLDTDLTWSTEETAAHFRIYVPKPAPPEEKSIKILAIGSSWADGMDFNLGGSSHLFQLLREAGYTDITLGLLDHVENNLKAHYNDA